MLLNVLVTLNLFLDLRFPTPILISFVTLNDLHDLEFP